MEPSIEVQIRRAHFQPGEHSAGQKPCQETSGGSGDLSENGFLWLTTVPESERKMAESKTSASRERTLSA